VLFANAITSCSGINVPEATDVVLMHSMHRTKTAQIIGRCRRMSTNPSQTYRIHHLYQK
jgi:hypothetical protein